MARRQQKHDNVTELVQPEEKFDKPKPNNHLKLRIDDLKTFDPLTDNQKKFFDAYKQGDYFIALHGVAGTGKAQPLDAKILTPSSWKLMGDLNVGDLVVTPKGDLAPITGIFPQGKKEIFQITFHDGSSTRACAEHLWGVWYPDNNGRKAQYHVVNTLDILSVIDSGRSVSVDMITPTPGIDCALPITPYVLGALLGDGGMTHHISLTSADSHIIEKVTSELDEGYTLSQRGDIEFAIIQKNQTHINTKGHFTNFYKQMLSELGLYGCTSAEKFIPSSYNQCSLQQRLELIRGLLDTDGTVGKRGTVSYTTVSHQLALDVQQLLWSVGATCTITHRVPHYSYLGETKAGKRAYTLHIAHPTPKLLFSLPRKQDRLPEQFAHGRVELRRRVSSIEVVGEEEAQCIMIDSEDHLYVTDDYIVTHNTFVALYKAIEEVLDKSNPFDKIIIVRSAVPSREVGHLPGDLEEKTQIYRQPYQQICHTLFGRPDAYQRLEEQGYIEFISTSFIRGQSFDDAIIIVDECQNMNWSEISTVMTRVGYRSKIIWCGDYRQTDLNKSRNDVSGVKQFLEIAKTMPSFTHIEFVVDDIVRSSLVRDWIIACNKVGVDL